MVGSDIGRGWGGGRGGVYLYVVDLIVKIFVCVDDRLFGYLWLMVIVMRRGFMLIDDFVKLVSLRLSLLFKNMFDFVKLLWIMLVLWIKFYF